MTLPTKPVLDGTGGEFTHLGVADGSGNFALGRVVLKADASAAIDPATEQKQDALIALVGAVAPTPAANTIMDRLKAIATGLGSVVLGAGSAVIGKVGLQVAGSDVGSGNPVPVSAATLPLPSGAATAAQIGEVQASPTANTVLDRLKAIATGLGSVVLGAGGAVIGKVGLQVAGADVSAANPVTVADLDMLAIAPASLAATGTLFTQDCTGYSSVSVQVTAAGGGSTIIYEMSDDNSNWVSAIGLAASGTGTTISSSTATGIYVFRVAARYFRARVGTYVSGTVTALGALMKAPIWFNHTSAVSFGATAGVTASTSGVQVLAIGKSANPAAVTDAQAVRTLATLLGSQVVQPYALPSAKWRSGPITVSASDQALKPAGAAGVKSTATWGILICDASWTANSVQLRDGTTVMFELPLPAGAGYYPMPPGFELIGSAATAFNIKASGAVTGTCTANFGGHAAAD